MDGDFVPVRFEWRSEGYWIVHIGTDPYPLEIDDIEQDVDNGDLSLYFRGYLDPVNSPLKFPLFSTKDGPECDIYVSDIVNPEELFVDGF